MNINSAELQSLENIRQAQVSESNIKDLLKWRSGSDKRPDWAAVSASSD